MVKHLIRWVVCLCLCATGINTAWAETTTFDFTQIDGFSNWGSSYSDHKVEYTEGDVIFSSANKQTSTITNMPVTKGQPVSFVLKNKDQILTGVKFQCKQWGSKAQTITLNYSTDGGTTYATTGITSSNFSLTANSLPDNTNAVKFTFSSTSNQIGIQSLKITYSASNDTREVVDITSFTAEKTTINIFETVTTTVGNNQSGWTPAAYTYTSSNTAVATVDENGVITGKAAGNANIVVKANVANNDENYKAGKADTLKITVEDNRALVNLTGFTATETTLTKGETTTTTVSNDQDGWTANYTYSSNKESVATVDENGVITAVAKGQATITVTAVVDANDRGYKAGETLTKNVVITVNNPKHTVTFMANGQKVSEEAMEEDATITFNNPDAQYIPEGQTFMGWAAAAFEGTQENAPALVKSATVGTTDVTYYAVFATASTSGNANWVKKTVKQVVDNPETGDYALITPDGNAFNGTVNKDGDGNSTEDAFDFNTSNEATSAPEGTCMLSISRKGDKGIEIAIKDGGKVITASKASRGGFALSDNSEGYYWELSSNDLIYSKKYNTNNAHLRSYSNTFRTYSNATNNAIAFAYRPSITYTDYCTTVGGNVDNREYVKFSNWATENGELTLVKGNTLATVTTLDKDCTSGSFTYESSNPEVATIAADGVITAVAKGEATLTATFSLAEDDDDYRLSKQYSQQTLTIYVVNPEHTVTFAIDGEMTDNKVREEEAIVFPAVTAPTGLVFAGWAAQDWKGMQYTEPAWVNTTSTVMGETNLEFVAVFTRVSQKGNEVKYSLTEEQIQEHFTQTEQAYGDEERSWNDESVTWRFFGKSVKDGTYLQINSSEKESYIAFNSQNYITNIAFNILNGSSREYDNSLYIYDATTGSSVTTVRLNKVKEASIAIEGNHKNLYIKSGGAAKISNIVLTCVKYVGYATTATAANEVQTAKATIADCGYTTICLPYNAIVEDENVKAYALRAVDANGLHFTKVDTLVAGKGYVLQATAGAEVELTEVLEPSNDTINILGGVVNRTLRESLTFQGTGNYAYPWILAKDGTFKRYTGTYIPAGKAYLDGALLQDLQANQASALRVILEEDEVTALSQLHEEKATAPCYYNLQGQRIAQPTQAGVLYIEQSGRKLILRK